MLGQEPGPEWGHPKSELILAPQELLRDKNASFFSLHLLVSNQPGPTISLLTHVVGNLL